MGLITVCCPAASLNPTYTYGKVQEDSTGSSASSSDFVHPAQRVFRVCLLQLNRIMYALFNTQRHLNVEHCLVSAVRSQVSSSKLTLLHICLYNVESPCLCISVECSHAMQKTESQNGNVPERTMKKTMSSRGNKTTLLFKQLPDVPTET